MDKPGLGQTKDLDKPRTWKNQNMEKSAHG